MFNLFKKQQSGVTVSFKISGMHCTSCSMSIDGELEDLPGVISSDTSYAQSTTTVVYDPTVIDEQKLAHCIEQLEYGAEKVTK